MARGLLSFNFYTRLLYVRQLSLRYDRCVSKSLRFPILCLKFFSVLIFVQLSTTMLTIHICLLIAPGAAPTINSIKTSKFSAEIQISV